LTAAHPAQKDIVVGGHVTNSLMVNRAYATWDIIKHGTHEFDTGLQEIYTSMT